MSVALQWCVLCRNSGIVIGVDSVGLPNQSWTDKRQCHRLRSGRFRAFQHRPLLLGCPARGEAGQQTLPL